MEPSAGNLSELCGQPPFGIHRQGAGGVASASALWLQGVSDAPFPSLVHHAFDDVRRTSSTKCHRAVYFHADCQEERLLGHGRHDRMPQRHVAGQRQGPRALLARVLRMVCESGKALRRGQDDPARDDRSVPPRAPCASCAGRLVAFRASPRHMLEPRAQ